LFLKFPEQSCINVYFRFFFSGLADLVFGSVEWVMGMGARSGPMRYLVGDGARRDRAGDAGGGVGGEIVAVGDQEAEDGRFAVRAGLCGHQNRQIALNGMQPEGRLIAVMPETPGEDAHLVEVIGKAGFRRTHHGYVLRNLVVGRAGLGVEDLVENVGSYVALALGIGTNLVRHIHIDAAGEQPAGVALRVAHQPPVFHYRRHHRGLDGRRSNGSTGNRRGSCRSLP
jgi:hypothetical protein